MKNPSVSIIMATYNRAHFIEEAIRSIQNQSFSNWECLIIDDGSKDKTVEVLKSYLDKDDRFKYLKRSSKYKKGLPGCRNMGLDLAKGDYIVFFDDDDIVHPQNLEICLYGLEDITADFCRYEILPFFGNWNQNFQKYFDVKQKSCIGINQLNDVVVNRIGFFSCSVLWRKKCFDEIRFNETLMYAEEWECYTRLLTSGFSGMAIKNVLYFNRKHSKSNTGEFAAKNEIRTASKIKATKLVMDNLNTKGMLTGELKQFFMRTGFRLNDYSIISHTLKIFEAPFVEHLKYKAGFLFYPLLRRYFQLIQKK